MKKKRPRLYEGMYILSAALSEDARKKAFEKIKLGITSRKGEINKIHEMGKLRFAYEIKKRKEGFYYLIYFTIDSSSISELWEEYKLHEDLLRFMTLEADSVRENLEYKTIRME